MENVEYTDRDLRRDLTRTIRAFPIREDSFPTVGRIFSRLNSNPGFSGGRYRQEVKAIVELASEFGCVAPDVLRLFEYAMLKDAKCVAKVNFQRAKRGFEDNMMMFSDITKNLRSRIRAFKTAQGNVPRLERIGRFIDQYLDRYNVRSHGNSGKEAPGVADKMAQIALEGFVEANDYEY